MRLAFVIPWYGPEIPGGAENLCRQWAEHLAAQGDAVEVLTTTIRQFQSNWNKAFHRPGVYTENGVTVRRFPLRPGNHELFNRINRALLQGLSVTAEEELAYFVESSNSDELVQFISGHREEYLFVFIPYPFGTTVEGSRAAGSHSILLPCLHDEPYAHLAPVRQAFESARGIIFNSEKEQALAERLYRIEGVRKIVLGVGLDTGIRGDGARFRKLYDQRPPFVLYVGRRDAGKNVDLLQEYFNRFRVLNSGCDLELLLAGQGEVDTRPYVRDLGFLATQDKYDAYNAALAFCNPSVHESFSIVLMESWLCRTPALVHAACEVTRDYVERSAGGIYFSDFYEFEAGLNFLLENPEAGRAMADNGADFVQRHFSWDTLIGRFRGWMAELGAGMGRPGPAGGG